MHGIYRLADLTVQVDSLHPLIHRMLADYSAPDEAPELSVRVTEAMIASEREKADAPHADAYLETLAVLRALADQLPAEGRLLIHGSAVAVDGAAVLFAAPSGTGKSTHARLWRERFGSRAVMINDDKPFLRVAPSGVVVYGTPWNGKHHLSANTCAPLRAVVFLEQSGTDAAERVTPADVLPQLFLQCYRPADPEAMRATLALMQELARQVPLLRLRCTMEQTAVDAVLQALEAL